MSTITITLTEQQWRSLKRLGDLAEGAHLSDQGQYALGSLVRGLRDKVEERPPVRATESRDIVGYTYKAEVLCPPCTLIKYGAVLLDGETVEETLDDYARYKYIDRLDEHSFDTDDFPKVVLKFAVSDGECCMSCGEALR